MIKPLTGLCCLLLITACSSDRQPEPQETLQTLVLETEKSVLPNVVLILTDDQGWGDLSLNGNPHLSTPRIDSIASQGVSFDRFYVNPVCSPTRAALLTGRHPLKTGVFSVTRGGEKMRSEEVTLAEMLKAKGYQTGLFGKWHNGSQYPHDPNGQGFDEYLGLVEGHQTLYFDPMLMHNGTPVKTQGYIADVTTDAALDFMDQNADQAFFAYLPFNTPHGPFEVPQGYFDEYKNKGLSDLDAAIYGMMENIDDNVGRVLDKLDQLGILNNTIVIYMSDNGPAFPGGNRRYNGDMKGHKGKIDEGGVRVPMLVHWPDRITGGHVIRPIAQHLDVVPTVMSLIGEKLDEGLDIDGDDISPLLLNPKSQDGWADRTLFVHHLRNARREGETVIAKSPGAARTQRWLATLQQDNQWRLYDLQADPLQKQNVAADYPEQLAALKASYLDHYADITANGYQPIPAEIGHPQRQVVPLAAHEAYISGQGIDYAHGDGWAHDWIELRAGDLEAEIKWPIKTVSAGEYQIELLYASQGQQVDLLMALSLGKVEQLIRKQLPAFTAKVDHGNRLYYTGEAPELSWQKTVVARLNLDEGSAPLRFVFDTPLLEEGVLAIKGIRIIKLI